MDVPNLPRHVLERAERRWAAVLSRQAALRPAGKLPGMQEPPADRLTRLPAELASKPGIEPAHSDLRLQR